MGISNLDPGAHERRPWNAGSLVGAKRHLNLATYAQFVSF